MKEITDNEQELLSHFKWDDDDEEPGDEVQPEAVLATSIFDCAERIHQYIIDNMGLEHIAGDDTIEVSVPASVDPLLEARYEESYTEESRLQVFDLLRAAFRFKLDYTGFKTAEKINELMPQQNKEVQKKVQEYVQEMKLDGVVSTKGGIKRKIHVIRCDLHDEPSMDVTVTQRAGTPMSPGGGNVVDTKTESSKQCICAEITFESRRTS